MTSLQCMRFRNGTGTVGNEGGDILKNQETTRRPPRLSPFVPVTGKGGDQRQWKVTIECFWRIVVSKLKLQSIVKGSHPCD